MSLVLAAAIWLALYVVVRTETMPRQAKRSAVIQHAEMYGTVALIQERFPPEQSFTFSFKIVVTVVQLASSIAAVTDVPYPTLFASVMQGLRVVSLAVPW